VHRNRCSNGFAAKRLIDALHAQTYAEDGPPAAKGSDEGNRDPGVGRIFGTGADKHIVRIKYFNLIQRDLITPVYLDIQVVVFEHLNEIVGKRIIIIDDKQLGHTGNSN